MIQIFGIAVKLNNMSYILNIPIYRYNTGRADNGNTTITRRYENKECAIKDRDFLNEIFNRNDKEDLDEDLYNRLQEIIDWQGFQIKDSYVTIQYEQLIIN